VSGLHLPTLVFKLTTLRQDKLNTKRTPIRHFLCLI